MKVKFPWIIVSGSIMITVALVIGFSRSRNTFTQEIPVYRKLTYEIPEVIDPLRNLSTAQNAISTLIFEGLVGLDKHMQIVPALATSWDITDHGHTYVFHLKKGARFHDETMVASSDVVRSIRRLQAAKSTAHIFRRVASVSATSDDQISISLESPYSPFLSLLAASFSKVTKPAASGDSHIGTGPFRILRRRPENSDNVLILERFDNYHGDSPKIHRLELVKMNQLDAIESLRLGFIHDSVLLPLEESPSDNSVIVEKQVSPAAVTWILALNTSRSPLSNGRLRKCLSVTFPRDGFVSQFVPDHRPAQGFFPPTVLGEPLHTEDTSIDCADVTGTKLTLSYPDVLPNGKAICDFITSSWTQSLAVSVQCQPLEFAELLREIKEKTADISLFSQTLDLPDPEYFINVFESNAELNYSNYSSPVLDQMIAKVRLEQDRKKRYAVFSDINHHLYDNSVTINISYPLNVVYHHTCVEGLHVGLAGESYVDYRNVRLRSGCIYSKHFQ